MPTEAADEASRGCLGGQWHTEEHCPSSSPVGAALQAAHKDLGKVDFRTPEGLLAGLDMPSRGLGIATSSNKPTLPRTDLECQVSISGARVAQEVYEPLIGIQYPMLCSCKNGRWQIGTGSIREDETPVREISSCDSPFFFHECGRHVGGVPRSSLKGKETLHDEGEKNTSDPKQQKPTKTNKHHKPKKKQHGQRPIPPHQSAFPLYEGETCENDKS